MSANFQKIALGCLTNVYECDSIVEVHVSESQQNQILSNITELWASLPLRVVTKYDVLQTVMTSTIQFTAFLVRYMDNSQVWIVRFILIVFIRIHVQCKMFILNVTGNSVCTLLPQKITMHNSACLAKYQSAGGRK